MTVRCLRSLESSFKQCLTASAVPAKDFHVLVTVGRSCSQYSHITQTAKQPLKLIQKMDESGLIKNSIHRDGETSGSQDSVDNANQESPLYALAKLANRFYFEGFKNKECKPMFCKNVQIGLVRKSVEEAIANHSDVFRIEADHIRLLYEDYQTTSKKLNEVMMDIKKSHDFEALRGWRDEDYEIRTGGLSSTRLFKIERAATSMFGFKQYGVDITGYVNDPDKGLCVWLQRRSLTKPTWPGRWDSMACGGFSVGYTIKDTAIREALEEANVPNEMAEKMKPAGCVTFFFESGRGIFPQTEFVFDLELPLTFQPANNDGEVEEFALIPASELASRICETDMKTTSCPVIMDFLVRHGMINEENEPNFVEVTELLHMPIHTFYDENDPRY